ncbi:hypothetical protein K440DRAFT_642690 [Wilcoxina mikolae CBS 423.85]|nr:hypothetical protein K440DRAFT_642690 [Wilcoxina mikolae CBS 423.85]
MVGRNASKLSLVLWNNWLWENGHNVRGLSRCWIDIIWLTMKTSGHVIDRLMTTTPSEKGRVVAYYFDFRRKESLSILFFLRSILHQVLRIDKISPEIQRRLEAIFIGTIMFLVVDGIDEAGEDVRKIVLQFLKDMQSCARVKIFAAGQPEVDITKFLAQCVTISITAREQEGDIRTFIDVQAEKELNGVLSAYKSVFIDKIKEILAWKAQGMFLWVDLQIKAIRGTCEDDGTADRVPKLLDDLPRDIQEIYSRALQKLLCLGDQRAEITRNVFQWVICARRPMNISELEEAATIKVGQKSWKEPPIKLSWPTQKASFQEIRSRSQGPLDKYNFSIEDQLRTVMSTSRATKFIPQFVLLDYCRTNWYHHCAVFSPDDDVRSFAELQKLVLRKQLPFRWQPWDPLDGSSPYPHWAMFYWAVLSVSEATGSWRRLWETDWERILLSACATADINLVDILLKGRTSGISMVPGELSNAIVHATSFGHLSDIDRLLQENPNLNARVKAAEGGHLAVVERLLQENADVNATDSKMTALQAAAGGGHLAVVERLLQENADVNASTSSYFGSMALQAAERGGHLAVVERLLQHGAREPYIMHHLTLFHFKPRDWLRSLRSIFFGLINFEYKLFEAQRDTGDVGKEIWSYFLNSQSRSMSEIVEYRYCSG